ncbi:MAG: Hpt domain-containing protein [Bacteroidetes bacterium]|nr:Hpt domain-containing protein [Bacteroidota bacterium]
MLKKEGDFQKRLLATFKVEAQEHVNTISSGLIELEKEAAIVEDSGAVRKKGEEIIETIFREAHSLKGAARAVNMAGIETICQSLESVFAALKRSKVALSPELFDILHKVVDFLSKLLSAAGTGQGAEERLRISELTRDLESVSKGGPPLHADRIEK